MKLFKIIVITLLLCSCATPKVDESETPQITTTTQETIDNSLFNVPFDFNSSWACVAHINTIEINTWNNCSIEFADLIQKLNNANQTLLKEQYSLSTNNYVSVFSSGSEAPDFNCYPYLDKTICKYTYVQNQERIETNQGIVIDTDITPILENYGKPIEDMNTLLHAISKDKLQTMNVSYEPYDKETGTFGNYNFSVQDKEEIASLINALKTAKKIDKTYENEFPEYVIGITYEDNNHTPHGFYLYETGPNSVWVRYLNTIQEYESSEFKEAIDKIIETYITE